MKTLLVFVALFVCSCKGCDTVVPTDSSAVSQDSNAVPMDLGTQD